MKFSELRDKKILIVGYGREGKSVHEYLKKLGINGPFGIADDVINPSEINNQESYDIAIRSPGIKIDKIKIPYTTLTNLFLSNTKCIVIGVTGSKGKSTTSTLIYSILKESGLRVHLAGNIGVPLSEVLEHEKKGDYCVCELSSYQLQDIEKSPHISVFINIFPEHMDYHGSFEKYFQAKSRIVRFAGSGDFFVFNRDYNLLNELAASVSCRKVPIVSFLPFPVSLVPLLGKHNIDNVRAAVTVAQLLQIDIETIKRAVRNFKSLPHRLEKIGIFKKLTFYDDAISTTPESTIKAIEAIPEIGTIFLGGLDRGYNFHELAEIITAKLISNVILFPDSGTSIKNALIQAGYSGQYYETNSMNDAVKKAYEITAPGKTVLLSCASPSYSLWKNFEEKGSQFQQAVRQYGV